MHLQLIYRIFTEDAFTRENVCYLRMPGKIDDDVRAKLKIAIEPFIAPQQSCRLCMGA